MMPGIGSFKATLPSAGIEEVGPFARQAIGAPATRVFTNSRISVVSERSRGTATAGWARSSGYNSGHAENTRRATQADRAHHAAARRGLHGHDRHSGPVDPCRPWVPVLRLPARHVHSRESAAPSASAFTAASRASQ